MTIPLRLTSERERRSWIDKSTAYRAHQCDVHGESAYFERSHAALLSDLGVFRGQHVEIARQAASIPECCDFVSVFTMSEGCARVGKL
jgi:hypothetical protein